MRIGVTLFAQRLVTNIQPGAVTLSDVISGETSFQSADAVVLVSDRISNDGLYYALKPALEDGSLDSLQVIGDALAPNIIAQAVFSGHKAAREFGEIQIGETPFRVEFPWTGTKP